MKKITDYKKPNNFRALLGLTKASIISTLRSPTALFFNFFFPFIFIIIFGLLSQGEMSFDVGVRNHSLKSGQLYETLSDIEMLTLVTEKTDTELDEDLAKGRIAVVIDIQKDGEIQTAPTQSIDKYTFNIEKSAADPENVQAISVVLDNIIQGFNKPPENLKVIDVQEETVEGRKFEQIDFILPGQLAFALLTNALFGISYTIVSLREKLVIKRIFAAPVKRGVILGAEVISKIIIAILQSVLIITVGHFIFNFTLAHGLTTFASMMVLSLVGITVFLAFGLFVAAVSKDEETVSPLANLIMMPQLFLAGAFFPIEAFPEFLQPIAKILPMTFLNEAFKMVAFEGVPLRETLPQIAGIVVWGGIMYLIVIKLFKWEN